MATTHTFWQRSDLPEKQGGFPFNDFVTLRFHTRKSHVPNRASPFWLLRKMLVAIHIRTIEENFWHPTVAAIGNTFPPLWRRKTQWLTLAVRRQMGWFINRLNILPSSQAFRSEGRFICRRIKSESTCTGLALLFCKYEWMPLGMSYSRAFSPFLPFRMIIMCQQSLFQKSGPFRCISLLLMDPAACRCATQRGRWRNSVPCFLIFVLVEDGKSRPVLYLSYCVWFSLIPSYSIPNSLQGTEEK